MPKIEFLLASELKNHWHYASGTDQDSQEPFKIRDDCPPQPAKSFIPVEYKKLSSYHGNDLRESTVKKCMPFLDALTSGYIIPFYQDYIITVDNEKKSYHIKTGLHKPQAHSWWQLPEGYQDGKKPIGKFTNKWVIRTPPGYSCLFIHPFNRPKMDYEAITGVVDTDVYNEIVHCPYFWKRYNDEKKSQVHIKKGEPMIQIIPFKRESWTSWSGIKERKNKPMEKYAGMLKDIYKKFYWKKKEYK